MNNKKIPIEVSARHIHLSQRNLEMLFGKGYELTKIRQLTQPCDFAAEEILDIQAGDRKISKVRIVGPVRKETQIELSQTDAFNLGINLPVKMSGDLRGTLGITLIGPKGKTKIKEGVIDDMRHIHCNPKEAKLLGLDEKKTVSVKIDGEKSLTFHNVKVRINENYKLCMHIDTDEGNAAGILKKGFGYLVKS